MDIEKIIALHRYALHEKSVFYKMALICHSLFLLIFKKYNSKVFEIKGNNNKRFLFFKALHRPDYDELHDKISSQCSYDKIIIEAKVSYGIDFSFLSSNVARLIEYKKIKSTIFLDRVYLFFSYFFYIKVLSVVKNYDFDTLVVFADMQPVDNLLVQYYNKRSVKTVSLQHGLFVDYEGVYNISSVSYENVVSDYFLTWGENNKKLIQHHNPNCVVKVCGNPSVINYNKKVGTPSFFTVFLDWDVFKRENVELLNIAYKLSDKINMKFNLRMHPSNDKKNYNLNKAYVISKEVDFMDSYFMLGHTSSMIHICQRLGLPVFKYDTDVPTNPIDHKYYFKSAEDVFQKVNNICCYTEKYKENIGPIAENSLLEYKNFFDSME